MAKQEIPIKITVDTKDAQGDVENLKKGVDDTGKSVKKAGEEAKKGGGFFNGLWGTMKAFAGIGIISKGFDILSDAFSKNQKVADLLSAVTGTLASLLTQVIDVITGVIDRVSKSTNGFEALGKVMKGLLTLVLTPFKLVFFEIKLAVQALQLSWETSIFGEGDKGKIKQLTEDIKATKDSLIDTGKNAINAGKDIATNFVEAAKSVGNAATGIIDGVSKIDVAATFEQQKSIVRLKNSAELAAAELAGLIEKYDRQAEQQRQIRDDETKSIDDRIKANEELGKILEQQRIAQLAQAAKILESAQAQAAADKNNNQLKKAEIEARNNVAAVEAQITGLQSEQKVNAVGLAKIKIELGKQEQQATNQRLLNEQKATAELIKNENDKLAAKKKIFEEESRIELARLQGVVDSTNAGTEARIAAEIELANKKSELAIQGQALDRQILETGLNTQLEQINKQKEIYQLDFDARKGFLEQEKALLDQQLANKLITDQQYLDAKRNITAQENQLEMDKFNLRKQLVDEASSLITSEFSFRSKINSDEMALLDMQLSKKLITDEEYQRAKAELVQKEMDLQAKKVKFEQSVLILKQIMAAQELMMEVKKNIFFGKSALAQGLVATKVGAAKTAAIGFPQNIPMLIGYGIQAASIIMSIRQAIKTMAGAGDIAALNASSSGISTSAPISQQLSPQVAATQVNTAAVNQLGNRATRAYVLNSDIQNEEQRNAYINRNASIGNP
jgi:hypothetical protein